MIIGLSGVARSGKDTVADHLIKNYDFVKVSFADPIREALIRLDPTISVAGNYLSLATAVRLIGWEELKAESPDIRELMQRMGTEVGREMFYNNIWVDAALNRVKPGTNVVIADVRYPNEVEAIKAAGGKVWRIERPGVGPANQHPSETALVGYNFEYRIDNKGTLEDLYKAAEELLEIDLTLFK